MDLTLPTYDLKHTRPIVGCGNFSRDIENSQGFMVDTTVVEKKFELWDFHDRIAFSVGDHLPSRLDRTMLNML